MLLLNVIFKDAGSASYFYLLMSHFTTINRYDEFLRMNYPPA